MRRFPTSATLAAFLSLACVSPAVSPAHTEGADAAAERRIRAIETATLGAEHAAEHAAARAANTQPAGGARAARAARAARPSQARSGPASEVGRWTRAPFRIPTFAIHAAVLPTGQVMFWGYPPAISNPRPNVGQVHLWTPSKGYGRRSLSSIPAPRVDADGDGRTEPTPLYCSGQSFLPDGRIVLVGGNGRWPVDATGQDFVGLNTSYSYDPFTRQWKALGKMRQGRWYPSQVTLPDGRTVVLGGYNELEPGGLFNTDLEVLGTDGSYTHYPQGDRRTALYPHLALMPSGDVLLAGPGRGDSGLLDTDTWTWSSLPALRRNRVGGNMVMVPDAAGPRRILNIGGYDPEEADRNDDVHASASIESIDVAAPNPRWSETSQMRLPRSYFNAVPLPDGNAVIVGGGAGKLGTAINYAVRADHRNRHVELLDPQTGATRWGPAQVEDRAYHSTAVLLPDGRIFSAGDDANPDNQRDTAEIYSPPYLFRGRRPQITGAPSAVRVGDAFDIRVRGRGRRATRAVLMAPQAITHGTEMNARSIPLRIVGRTGGKLTLQLPDNPNVVPPQYYMLFVLNDRGVPSVARWVRVG